MRIEWSEAPRRITSTHRLWVACVLCCWLLACAPGPGATATPTPRATSGPKIIPFYTTETDPDQLTALHALVAEYQQLNPNVELDIVPISSATRGRRLLTALSAGADLGIFEIEPTLMVDWAEAGYLLPLDDIVNAIGGADFMAGSLFRYGGHVYAVPYAQSVYGLWVRTDLLSAAGLGLPRSYAQALVAAQALTHGGIYGIALPGGQNIAAVNYFSIFLWQNDGDYFSCDGQVRFGEPAALNALRRWKEMSQYAPPSFTTWDYREQIDSFLKGQVAMAIYGGRLGAQLDATNPELANRATVIFPPFGTGQVTLGIWSRFAIASGSRNQPEVKEFLRWLLSGDRLLRYDNALPGHMIPPLRSVRAMPVGNPAPYMQHHPDWIRSFYDWSELSNHPAMNMGSVHDGRYQRSDVVPPWAGQVFGTPGIIDAMLHEVNMKSDDPEKAWRDALRKLEDVTAAWKAAHPGWAAAPC